MLLMPMAMCFVTSIIVANVIAVKPVELNGWILPAGTIVYPLTFLITDTVSELYGRRVATRIVWYGFGLSAAMALIIETSRMLPAASFWQEQAAYDLILGSVPRIVLGSMIAYLVSQHGDVVMFHYLRRATGGRHLWLRNNASTTISQAIDTLLFLSIAFGGTVPMSVLYNMMMTQYLVKLGVAILDTPIVYALVYSIRARSNAAADAEALEASL